jgi:hypothetical protein
MGTSQSFGQSRRSGKSRPATNSDHYGENATRIAQGSPPRHSLATQSSWRLQDSDLPGWRSPDFDFDELLELIAADQETI